MERYNIARVEMVSCDCDLCRQCRRRHDNADLSIEVGLVARVIQRIRDRNVLLCSSLPLNAPPEMGRHIEIASIMDDIVWTDENPGLHVRTVLPKATWREAYVGQPVKSLAEIQNLCLAPLIDRTLALIEKRCLPQEAPKATKPSLPSRATSHHRMQIGLRTL